MERRTDLQGNRHDCVRSGPHKPRASSGHPRSPERDRAILELLDGSGLRASELVGINVDCFRDEDVMVVGGKGRKERFVIIGEYARVAIRAWMSVRTKLLAKTKLETSALLFSVGPRRSVERLDVRSVGRIVKAVTEARGLDPRSGALICCAMPAGPTCTITTRHCRPWAHSSVTRNYQRRGSYTRMSVGRMMQTYNSAHPHARQ